MNTRESRFHRHVRTSLAARIVYRVICLALIFFGVWGLFMASAASDHYRDYKGRNAKTVGEVTAITSEKDARYNDVEYCYVDYKFSVRNKEYTSKTAWRLLPTQMNCQLSKDATITIRYQKDNPANNSYNDNSQDREVAMLLAIGYALIGLVPLGIGFIGLVAIHKAVKSELQGEEEDEEAEIRAAKRRATVTAKKKAANTTHKTK